MHAPVAPNDSYATYPVLVVAYDDKVRDVIVKNLAPYGTNIVAFASFCEAEKFSLAEPCRAVLVDLSSMIKAKAEEKAVSYALTTFYPTLRVRAMGHMIIPMVMPGDAQQDKSLNSFVSKTCADRAPRRLRNRKRKDICVPIFLGLSRGVTLNLSRGGAFIVDMNPERFSLHEKVTVTFQGFELDVDAAVVRVQPWGTNRTPGVGLAFLSVSEELEAKLYGLLHTNRETDRDREYN